MDRSHVRENFILQGIERLVGKGRTLREGSLKRTFTSKQKLQTGCKKDMMEIIQGATSPPTGREGVHMCVCARMCMHVCMSEQPGDHKKTQKVEGQVWVMTKGVE